MDESGAEGRAVGGGSSTRREEEKLEGREGTTSPS